MEDLCDPSLALTFYSYLLRYPVIDWYLPRCFVNTQLQSARTLKLDEGWRIGRPRWSRLARLQSALCAYGRTSLSHQFLIEMPQIT